MSTKLSTSSSQRLASLLHSVASTEVAPKLPAVKKFLYSHEDNDDGLPSSILDGLRQNQWKQKPISDAPKDILLKKTIHVTVKSNILYFKCKNAYITEEDFSSLYPLHRERKYSIQHREKNTQDELDFKVVKSRNPLNLQFEGGYFLIFKSHAEACVYFLETLSKSVNGIGMNLRFVAVDGNKLKLISSPFLGTDGRNLTKNIQKKNGDVNLQNPLKFDQLYLHVPIQELFAYAPIKEDLIKKILESNEGGKEMSYSLLCKLIDSSRHSCVVVRNLPLGLSQHTLPKLLWDYELAPNPFTTILNDPIRQVNTQIIRFQHHSSAKRFVRNFHGKQWESMQHQKDEKRLYERLICEIVD